MRWLDLFSNFDVTFYHVPRKSNIFADACCIILTLLQLLGQLSLVFLVIFMRLRQLLLMTHGNSSRKWEVLLSMVLHFMMVCCTTHKV